MDHAIHNSSVALSLLRCSSLPSQSFVLSPFLFNSALAIVHDGADGTTQKELTEFLLNDSTPEDVSEYYSSIALSITSLNRSGVASAIRFYIDDIISLNTDYQKTVEEKYNIKVENLKLCYKIEAALEINEFVEQETSGKINNMLDSEEICGEAILISAIHFLGKWKYPFHQCYTHSGYFKRDDTSTIEMNFMTHTSGSFRANESNDIGTVLILPYQDENYHFFYLMPKESSNLENMRNELTGAKLVELINAAKDEDLHITVPKFKIESNLDGISALTKLGVQGIFDENADLSKISSTPLKLTQIKHRAVIEIEELGAEAAVATTSMISGCAGGQLPHFIVIDRPFLFGILRSDYLLFIGQFA